MRGFIPVGIVVAMALTACAPKSAPESTADAAVSASDGSTQEAVVAPTNEERIATGISVDVCKLPKLSGEVETFPPTLIDALGSCRDEGNTTIEIDIRERVYISLNDSSLSVFQAHSNQYDSMEAFINDSFEDDERKDFEMEKDQAMSDRLGFETSKVTYRLDSEEEGVEQVEGYCFNYGYADYCIGARSRGGELNEFKDALFSNMKLVTKTKAEIEKEQEELKRLEQEQWEKRNKEMIEKFGGKPALKMKNPEVSGAMDKRIIQKVVRQHSAELRACYEKELAKTKGISGRIVVNWEIEAQGSVSKAEVKESTVGNSDLESCFTESIKFWRFPAPKGGQNVKVDYPFELMVQTGASE